MSGNNIVIALTLTLTALLGLTSCAKRGEALQLQQVKIVNSAVDNKAAKEDAYALIAMDAYERGDFKTASLFFEKLYDLDPQKDYLTDAIKAASMGKAYNRIKHLIEKGKGEFGDDKFINRYLVAYYLDQGKITKAREITRKLLQKNPQEKDYELAALIEKVDGNLPQAMRYFRTAYNINHNPKIAVDIAGTLFDTQKQEEAIRLLETHRRIYGCDKTLCSALVKIYTRKQDVSALEQLYKEMYRTTKDPLYARALLELYVYRKDYDAAITFLEKHHLSDETLLDIYTAKKSYKDAYKLALKLYKENGDLEYLAKAAILEYEGSTTKPQKLLKSVLDKFEKSVYIVDDPLYYNYYAYLLINHNIDVEKGIKLVKKALNKEPDSLFYIDTLAWGYYRLGRCEEAYKLMKPYEKDQSQPEIVEHIRKIKQCIKEKKQ